MNPTPVNEKVLRLFRRKMNNPVHTNFSALGFSQRALCWNSAIIDGRMCFQGAFKFEDARVKPVEPGNRRKFLVEDESAYKVRVYINEYGNTTGVAFRVGLATADWQRRVIANVVWSHLRKGEGSFSIEKAKVPPRIVATSGAVGNAWVDKPYKQVLVFSHGRLPKSDAHRRFPELCSVSGSVCSSYARRYYENNGLLFIGELVHLGEWHEFNTETRHWIIPNTVAMHAAPLDLRRSRKQLSILRSAEKQLITTQHLLGQTTTALVGELHKTGAREDVERVVRDVEAGNGESDALISRAAGNTTWRRMRAKDIEIHHDVLTDKEKTVHNVIPTYPRPAPGKDDSVREIRRWYELEAMAALYAPKPKVAKVEQA